MKFSAVVFDLFGTLVDDYLSSVGQMHTELAVALAVPYERFMRQWNETSEMRTIGAFETVEASIEYVCSLMGARVEAEQMTKAVEIRLKYTRQALKPRPNAIATLGQLKNQGYKIGLISNCSMEIPILWQDTAFANVIDTPIFSCRARLKKPDIRVYHLASERLGVMPGSCFYIADGEDRELTGAARAGMRPVLIRTASHETNSGLHQEAREWQGTSIATLADVLRLVKRQLRD